MRRRRGAHFNTPLPLNSLLTAKIPKASHPIGDSTTYLDRKEHSLEDIFADFFTSKPVSNETQDAARLTKSNAC